MGRGRDARDSAELFLLPWAGLLGADFEDLALVSTRELMDGALVAVRFAQFYGDVPVHEAWLTVTVRPDADSGIVLISNNIYDLRGAVLAAPTLTASAVAGQWAEAYPDFALTDLELVVYAHSFGRPVAPVYAYRFSAGKESEAYRVVVDATDGALLEAVPLILDFADVTGTVTGEAFTRTDASYHSIDADCSCAEGSKEPLPDLFVRFNSGTSWWSDEDWMTDESGDYLLQYPGTPGYVKAELNGTATYSAGKYVRTESSVGTTMASSMFVSGGTSGADIDFSSLYDPGTSGYEFDMAHVTAFYWITKSSEIATSAASANVLGDLGLNQLFTCKVSQAGYGGGGYDGARDLMTLGRSGIYGGAGSETCAPSPAPTIILHEHSHRMRYYAYDGGSAGLDFVEGSADAWAAIVAGTSCLGRGLDSPYDGTKLCPCPELHTFCYRNADNTLRYPSLEASNYTGGLVLAGAYWDTYTLMQAAQVTDYEFRLQKLFINSLLLTPPGIDRGIVIDLLTLDDSTAGVWWGGDGDILNGTPHYDYIARGFGGHNLDAPGLFDVSYPDGRPANVQGGEEELTVRLDARTSGLLPEDVDRVRLYYRSASDEAFLSVDLERPGSVPEDWPDDWTVDFPDPGGDIVEYYVTVKAVGQEYEMPDPPEAAPYGGAGGATLCEAVYVTYSRAGEILGWYDDFETDRGWTLYPTEDNPWERVVPTVYQGATSPPSDYDGSGRCYVTGNGQGEYVPADDYYLISPVIEIDDGEGSDADGVVRFASWYSNAHTYRGQTPPSAADVFEVEVRDADGGDWIKLDGLDEEGSPSTEPDLCVGPFEIESMTRWYEKYFQISRVFAPPLPDQIQVRFKASGFDTTGAVEAAIDWFEVSIFEL
jgi:hypothetical protein